MRKPVPIVFESRPIAMEPSRRDIKHFNVRMNSKAFADEGHFSLFVLQQSGFVITLIRYVALSETSFFVARVCAFGC